MPCRVSSDVHEWNNEGPLSRLQPGEAT